MNFHRYCSAVSPPRIAVRLCLGERHSAAAALTRDLNEGRGFGAPGLWLDLYEAGFGARGDLAGKLYSVSRFFRAGTPFLLKILV